MRESAAFPAVAVLLLLLASPATGEGDPHGLLSDPERCLRCHQEVPEPGDRTVKLRRDVVSLCLECHREKELSALHPVDIRPGTQVPPDLPLDEQGTITCATCHDPHGTFEADEPYVAESLSRRLVSLFTGRRKYRTFYLRRPNDKGQLCLTCHQEANLASEGFHVQEASLLDQYAGSAECGRCHPEIYREWAMTPHARMTRDVRTDPAAVLADFGGDAPFPLADVVYALGSHWTQRYVVSKGGKLYVKAAIWSVTQKAWDRSYWIDKPWTQYCQGCHTTGFEMREEPRYAELGVGCEACHGPGRAHARSGGAVPVVNPADLAPGRRDMVCESCHTTGHDRTGQFRFPLGYRPGRDLTRYYRGLLPKPGQDNASFQGDESYADRHRQWLFWADGLMEAKGLTCDVCKNFRSSLGPVERPRMTPSEHCLSCHRKRLPETPLHQAHSAGDVHCTQCHVPRVAPGGDHYSIHDHKFLFLEPEKRQALTPWGACVHCHSSETAEAARIGLASPDSPP